MCGVGTLVLFSFVFSVRLVNPFGSVLEETKSEEDLLETSGSTR